MVTEVTETLDNTFNSDLNVVLLIKKQEAMDYDLTNLSNIIWHKQYQIQNLE